MNRLNTETKHRMLIVLFFFSTCLMFGFVHHRVSDEKTEQVPAILEGSPDYKEQVGLRDAYSRTFVNSNGGYAKQQGYVPIHYKKDGLWLPFEDKIAESRNGIFSLDKTDLPIHLNAKSGQTEMQLDIDGAKIIFGENAVMEFVDAQGNIITSEKIQTGKYSAGDNHLTFENAWNKTDRIHRVHYWQVETDYIIKEKPAANISGGKLLFKENFILPQGWTVKKGQGTETELGWQGELLILNRKGEEKGKFKLPVYYEGIAQECSSSISANTQPNEKIKSSVGQRKNGAITGSYTYKVNNNIVELATVVSGNWLMEAGRSFPVTIDPTVTTPTYGNYEPSCYYPNFSGATMNIDIGSGRYVSGANFQFSYWSLGVPMNYNYFQITGTIVDGPYPGCTSGSTGYCTLTSIGNWTFANGAYASGSIPVTLGLSRVAGSASCDYDYSYIDINTWWVTLYYGICTPASITTTGTATIWTGAYDNNWDNSYNWTGGVPTSSVNAYIPACGTNPTIYGTRVGAGWTPADYNGEVNCRTITIYSDNGAVLTWNTNTAILNVHDQF